MYSRPNYDGEFSWQCRRNLIRPVGRRRDKGSMVCSGATQIILRPSTSEAGVFLHDLAPCDASAIIVAWELRFFPTAEASRPARALCSHGIFLGLLGTALRGTHFGRKVCFPRIFFSFVHHRIAAKTRKLECIDPYIRAPHESPLLCPRVPGTQRARLADALVVHPNWLSGSTGSAGGAGFQQHHVCHASSG